MFSRFRFLIYEFYLLYFASINRDGTLKTDILAIRQKITEIGSDQVLAVHSTISCFAPRQPDSIPAISELCHEFEIPHVSNGAYCLQISKAVNLINSSKGKNQRLDCVVFSLGSISNNFYISHWYQMYLIFKPFLVQIKIL